MKLVVTCIAVSFNALCTLGLHKGQSESNASDLYLRTSFLYGNNHYFSEVLGHSRSCSVSRSSFRSTGGSTIVNYEMVDIDVRLKQRAVTEVLIT
jgi:hypothetical protein